MIKDADLKIDVYRNWADHPVVKVVHLPSGLHAVCNSSSSEKDNREWAIAAIERRLAE